MKPIGTSTALVGSPTKSIRTKEKNRNIDLTKISKDKDINT